MHSEDGKLTKQLQHICWDGCMFPNAVMMKQQTWNDILSAMIAVRDAHGWRDDDDDEEEEKATPDVARKPMKKLTSKKAPKKAKKPATKKAVRAATKHSVRKTPKRSAAPSRKSSKKTRAKRATKKKR